MMKKKKLKGATRNALLLHNSIHSKRATSMDRYTKRQHTYTIKLNRFLAPRSLGLGRRKHATQPPHSVSHSERSDQPKARYATEMLIIASHSPSDFELLQRIYYVLQPIHSHKSPQHKPHQVYGTHLSSQPHRSYVT